MTIALGRVSPAVNALLITLGLLFLMNQLVKVEDIALEYGNKIKLPVISDVRDEKPVDIIDPVLEIPKPQLQPKLPDITFEPEIEVIDKGVPSHTFTFNKTREIPLPSDSELIVAVGIPPTYPRDAITRGIEGYAVVGFSVAASGAVFDPFIIESEPKSIFNKAALAAIKKFKFKPKMVNGKAVPVSGQQYMFTFKLDGNE